MTNTGVQVMRNGQLVDNARMCLFRPTCNLETIRDGRGGIFTWIPDEPVVEWNMLIFNPGKIRGNHFHEEFIEYFLVVEGYGVMVSRDTEGNETFIHMGKGQCVRTPKSVPHAFYAIERTVAMAFLSKNWDDCDPPIVYEDVLQHGRAGVSHNYD